MKAKPRYLSLKERTHYRSLEDVLGCKWSTAVVASVAQGVNRPGALERMIPGISTKVLNERLRRLVEFRILARAEFPGLPPHVEYSLTPMGRKLAKIVAQVRSLSEEHANDPASDA
jgi:DNA-binding HxlR family transcriptional regulator